MPINKLLTDAFLICRTNTNVDLILSGVDLLQQLDINSSHSENHPIINSLKEFKECFKYFFQKGSAAERSLEKSDDFNAIISKTNGLAQQVMMQHFNFKFITIIQLIL